MHSSHISLFHQLAVDKFCTREPPLTALTSHFISSKVVTPRRHPTIINDLPLPHSLIVPFPFVIMVVVGVVVVCMLPRIRHSAAAVVVVMLVSPPPMPLVHIVSLPVALPLDFTIAATAAAYSCRELGQLQDLILPAPTTSHKSVVRRRDETKD